MEKGIKKEGKYLLPVGEHYPSGRRIM